MSVSTTAGTSLIFYTGKNYAGTARSVAHGATGELAATSSTWDEQSVAMSAMEAFVFSEVNTADATVSYLGHVEAVIGINQTDLTLLYPSSDQFPLNYLGLDPAQAVLVWLDVDAAQAAPNAVASTALPGGGATTITTLSLPGRPGALGFVAKAEGGSVVANCSYGDYNTSDGTVAWSGISTGTLTLKYTGGGVTLTNGGGFPAGWTFSAPQMQGDGSWVVILNGASETISGVTANPTSITNDGVSSSLITATVVDGSGQPVSGVTVSWSTDQGNLITRSSVTNGNGQATSTLTDSGTPGTATITATLANSSTKTTTVTVQDKSVNYVIQFLTSDKTRIFNNGSDAATLTATVVDGSGQPVSGVTVSWTTSAGSINPGSSLTNSEGLATASLTDGGVPETVNVTASLANGRNMMCPVIVEETSDTYSISMATDKQTIMNNGMDTATITATITTQDGTPVDGQSITWSASTGTLSGTVTQTGTDGKTAVTLTDTSYIGTAAVGASLSAENSNQMDIAILETPLITGAYDDVGYSQQPLANHATTDDLGPTLSGTASPGSTVAIYLNGAQPFTTQTDSSGQWHYSYLLQAEMTCTFSVTVSDGYTHTANPVSDFVLTIANPHASTPVIGALWYGHYTVLDNGETVDVALGYIWHSVWGEPGSAIYLHDGGYYTWGPIIIPEGGLYVGNMEFVAPPGVSVSFTAAYTTGNTTSSPEYVIDYNPPQ